MRREERESLIGRKAPRPTIGENGSPTSAGGAAILHPLGNFAAGKDAAQAGSGLPIALEPELVERAARSNCTILITGDTGVGKGHLARWIHLRSNRRQGPYVPVNCGAIPESVVDSQLFGHVRGAFTGATSNHLGLIRAAEGGTLLLDEVGDLPMSAQVRLLRLLQDREVHPVGESRPVVVDVRVIAATNHDLESAVGDRSFREDLFFRLDVIRLHVPPLRERRDEIESLLVSFNEELAQLYKQPPLQFDREATGMLLGYDWPGNIRQLRTVMERLHVLCPDEQITPRHLREIGSIGGNGPEQGLIRLDRMKRDELRRILAETGGSVSEAADRLGVHRSTIYRWMRQLEC